MFKCKYVELRWSLFQWDHYYTFSLEHVCVYVCETHRCAQAIYLIFQGMGGSGWIVKFPYSNGITEII